MGIPAGAGVVVYNSNASGDLWLKLKDTAGASASGDTVAFDKLVVRGKGLQGGSELVRMRVLIDGATVLERDVTETGLTNYEAEFSEVSAGTHALEM